MSGMMKHEAINKARRHTLSTSVETEMLGRDGAARWLEKNGQKKKAPAKKQKRDRQLRGTFGPASRVRWIVRDGRPTNE
jgi:hypothetical protein